MYSFKLLGEMPQMDCGLVLFYVDGKKNIQSTYLYLLKKLFLYYHFISNLVE